MPAMNTLDKTQGLTDLSDRAHPQEGTVAHRGTWEGKQDPQPAPTEMAHPQLIKAPTNISGLDAIMQGGLPAGRPTLVCGGAGCGKTLFGITFLVEGILKFGEPGVLVSFEERPDELAANVQSLGYDLHHLQATKKLIIDYVRIERSEIEETGEYDLDGLFIRLGHAIDSIGAKRVTLDTIEALFSGLSDFGILRAELRRLFLWLKEKGVTAVITGERGEGQLTRHGLEEYVSDCVILLENRVHNQIMTRTLRVVKYRGSTHGTNEYPFLIDDQGISVLPITSVGLQHTTAEEVISTGVAGLDAMLGLKGYFRGSSVLMSGAAGTGKTIFAARFAEATCERGERSLFFALEESPEQIMRNVRSVGIDLQKHVDAGLLRFEAARPTLYGFEMHLARMNRDIDSFRPATTIIDPISSFRGTDVDVHSILLRMIDLLKSKGITAVLTRLLSERELAMGGDQGISSIIDTWVSLIDIESDGERNRGIYLYKSRGMDHSNQIREYQITDSGLRFFDIYRTASGELLRGSARERAEGSSIGKRPLKAPLRRRRSSASKGK
jgi:circadian clock protein KaiC